MPSDKKPSRKVAQNENVVLTLENDSIFSKHQSQAGTNGNQFIGLLVNICYNSSLDLLPNIWLNFSFTSIYKLFQFNTLINLVNMPDDDV